MALTQHSNVAGFWQGLAALAVWPAQRWAQHQRADALASQLTTAYESGNPLAVVEKLAVIVNDDLLPLAKQVEVMSERSSGDKPSPFVRLATGQDAALYDDSARGFLLRDFYLFGANPLTQTALGQYKTPTLGASDEVSGFAVTDTVLHMQARQYAAAPAPRHPFIIALQAIALRSSPEGVVNALGAVVTESTSLYSPSGHTYRSVWQDLGPSGQTALLSDAAAMAPLIRARFMSAAPAAAAAKLQLV